MTELEVMMAMTTQSVVRTTINYSRGNDRLRGGDGNDILTGSTTNLVGERDTLTGGTGGDFLCCANQVFYDDLNRTTAGRGDYALVNSIMMSFS